MTSLKTVLAAAALVGASTLGAYAQAPAGYAGQYEFFANDANRAGTGALVEGRNSVDYVATPRASSDAYAGQYEFLAQDGRRFNAGALIEGRNSAVLPQPQQNDLTDRSGR